MNLRNKLCEKCGLAFVDDSRGNWKKTCSRECAIKLRVEKSRASGAYDWDDERRKRNAKTVKKNQALGIVQNPWTRDDVKAKIKATNLARYGVENWKQTPEGRESTAKMNRDLPCSITERRKHSANARKQMKGGLKSRGRAGIRADIPGFFRSSWEANYARILRYENRQWQYEPKTFELSSGITYTPDFLVDGIFVEIKGWMDARSRRQLDEFKQDYPNIVTQVIGPKEYRMLKQQYSSLVVGWE